MNISPKLNLAFTIAKEGNVFEVVTFATKRVWSTEETYVLRRDLTVPLIPRPEARIPICTRRLAPDDMPQIVAERPSGMLMGVLRAGLPQCYVAVTRDNEICYLQWLFSPEHRERLLSIRFLDAYAFDDDSVVLEFAYTFRRFRGLGIMAAALADIAAEDKRAHWALTYVPRSNIPSLRGCRGAGFLPYRISYNRWRFFRLIQHVDNPNSLEAFWAEDRNIKSHHKSTDIADAR